MEDFLGTYDYSLDEKNRLSIPAKYRKVMQSLQEDTFIVTTLEDACLTLYPYVTFRQTVSEPVKALRQFDDDANELRRFLGMHSTDVKMDSQGRINLPASACEHAGINKKVKLIGCGHKIELWNPEKFQEISTTRDAKSIKAELQKFAI